MAEVGQEVEGVGQEEGPVVVEVVARRTSRVTGACGEAALSAGWEPTSPQAV